MYDKIEDKYEKDVYMTNIQVTFQGTVVKRIRKI